MLGRSEATEPFTTGVITEPQFYNMFNSQLVLALVLLTTHCVLSKTYEEIRAECEKELKFTDIKDIKFNDPKLPKEAKCAVACTLEKLGVFKEDGSIDVEKEKKVIEEAVADEDLKKKFLKAVEECDHSAKATKCDTAFEFVKCKREKAGVKD